MDGYSHLSIAEREDIMVRWKGHEGISQIARELHVPSLHVLLSDASIGTRTVLRKSVERIQSRASIRSALHEPDLVTAEVFVGHDGIFMRREDSWQPSSACTSLNSFLTV